MDRDLSNDIFRTGMRRLLAAMLMQAVDDARSVPQQRNTWTHRRDTCDGITVVTQSSVDIEHEARAWLRGDDARAIASSLGITRPVWERGAHNDAATSDWQQRLVLGRSGRAA